MTNKRKLNDATNAICEFAEKNLPTGWTLQLVMTHEECYFELLDPYGDVCHDVYSETCGVADHCDYARENDSEYVE